MKIRSEQPWLTSPLRGDRRRTWSTNDRTVPGKPVRQPCARYAQQRRGDSGSGAVRLQNTNVMLIHVTPKGLYDVPEGTFHAVCVEVYETYNKCLNPPAKSLRIVWELPDIQIDSVPCRASKMYHPSLAEGSMLRRDLHSWFGTDLKTGMFNTQTLVGKPGTLTIKHLSRPGRQRPALRVTSIQPPATRPSTQSPETSTAVQT
jgi:hypothetical protein